MNELNARASSAMAAAIHLKTGRQKSEGFGMKRLFDELSGKLVDRAGSSRKVGAQADIGMLLFAQREALRDLWRAADECHREPDAAARAALHRAVEGLRPLFGERAGT